MYRLAQISNIIDQCVAQACPLPANMAGGWTIAPLAAQVSRTFYARAADRPAASAGRDCSALARQIAAGGVKMHTRTEMLDLVVVDAWARGIVTRTW
ncbi:MAG: hypothetical protein R2911_31410 [Caldilineaceae bacterium]